MATPANPANAAPGPGGRIRRLDAVAVGLVAVIFLTEAAIGVLLLAINEKFPQARLHAGRSLVGLAFSFYFGAKVVGQPLAGWLADRTDPQRVLVLGVVPSIPAIIVMERWHTQPVYIVMWAVFGLSLAVIWPCAYAIVGRRFRPSVQGRLFALVSMGQIAGTAIGAGAGAALIDYVSYTAAYGLAVALIGLALLLAFGVVRGGPAGASASLHGDGQLPIRGLRAVRRIVSGRIALLALLFAVLSFGVSMLAPDLATYGERTLGLKYSTFTLLLVVPGIVAGALIVPAGFIADRFGRSLPMAAGLVTFGVMLATLTLTRSPLVAILLATAAAGGYVLSVPALSATQTDLTTVETRGAVTGFTTSIQAIGGVVGPPVGGSLTDAFGPLAPFRVASALVLVAFLISLAYAAVTRGMYNPAAHRSRE